MRELGDTGLSVFTVGIDGEAFGWKVGSTETAAILNSYLDVGGNLIATADHHSGGRSEAMIGSWLRDTGARSEVVLATTIGLHPDSAGLSPKAIVSATEASLRRLDTEYVDVLSLEGHDTSVPIDDTLEAVDMLRRAGKVGHLGVVRHSVARVRAMVTRAAEAAFPPVAVMTADFGLMQRAVLEREYAEVVGDAGISILARHPADLWGTGTAVGGSSRAWERARGVVTEIAADHGLDVAAITVAWVLARPAIAAALVSPSSVDELADALTARRVELSRQDFLSLDRVTS